MNRTDAELLLKTALANPVAQFREGQWEAIDALVNLRQKLLVVQRTGWGKSSVYFIRAARAEPWTGSAECYGSVASIRRITSLYPPYNSSLVAPSAKGFATPSHTFCEYRTLPATQRYGRDYKSRPAVWAGLEPAPTKLEAPTRSYNQPE